MNPQRSKVLILGGGAAGIFSSIQLAELVKGDGDTEKKIEISVYEKSESPLGKVKISGGGRCNVTHNLFSEEELSHKYPRGSRELKYAFIKFQPRDTIQWFKKHGVELKAEEDGRMFPISNSSSTIINCFLKEIKNNDIQLITKTGITSIYFQSEEGRNVFHLTNESGEVVTADALLIASGSNRKVWTKIQAMGHKIEEPVPSLFTFNVPDSPYQELPGISVPHVEVKILPKGKLQSGPLLITHWGFSGPAILKLSAYEARELAERNYESEFQINWLPNLSSESLFTYLNDMRVQNPQKSVQSTSLFQFPSRLTDTFFQLSNISESKRWAEVSNEEIRSLIGTLRETKLKMSGKTTFKEEFVTCGGIKRSEVNFETMESKKIPGLFFAGEVLDVDGITGGFNFQNAWTTGFIAANGIKLYLQKHKIM